MSTLFIVATPIGNLSDLSSRAKETLVGVDAILCEDTRVTAKLLAAFDIRKPLVAYHQHSDDRRIKEIIEMLRGGKSLALVTDAGTPGISDPGGRLVEAVLRAFSPLPPPEADPALPERGDERGVDEVEVSIVPIPGPSAIVAALSISGFPCDEFLFLGFPPNKKGRQSFFRRLATIESTVVLYESTHRIEKTLAEIDAVSPDRRLVVCRELTKMYETMYRGTAKEVTARLKSTSIKGEFVLILAPIRLPPLTP
jgi:16S rRNA (cytidine1402-2'-O)-methyltransferase